MDDIGKRFPVDPYPKRWFQAAHSRDVEQGQVVRLHHFGGRLICYRARFCKQIEQVIPIWEDKIYHDRPQLARGEGAITEFRAWARQSYEEARS
jgi:hypothetical protein